MVATLAALVLLAPAAALAYVDPGTGSFVIQGIIAAIVGAGVALKVFWHRITGLFGGKRRAADDDDD
ncbi:hypothetical protein KDM41_05730 [bacterium]|nr:hypothetical protein [bacterium]